MSEDTRRAVRPAKLLTQNSQLRALGIYNWSLPAWADRFDDDGSTFNTCPSAGICADLCYARVNAYRYPTVRRRHQQNLRYVLDLPGWKKVMTAELGHKKFHGKWIRIHDSGDFFSVRLPLSVAPHHDRASRLPFLHLHQGSAAIRRLVEPRFPWNFKWVYSLGGKHDSLLDPAYHRVADVFPSEEAITEQGWFSRHADDRLTVIGPAPVGMASNRIPHLQKRQGPHRFSELQQARDEQARERRNRRKTATPPEATTD